MVFIPAVPCAGFPDAEAGSICFQILFPRKSKSESLMEGVTLWKPASPTQGQVLVASASDSAISLQPGRWLWLASIIFLLQLNSLNQSQESKLLKEPGAIWRA